MFAALGYTSFLDQPIDVIKLYNLVNEHIAVRSVNSSAVDSLRRCHSVLSEGLTPRNTELFDNLIRLE